MEKVYLTAAQMAAAAPYERNMETAVKSDWTRGLGRNGARVLAQISKEVAGGSSYVNTACPDCVLRLARRVGVWYFDTKDRDAALAFEAEQRAAAAKINAALEKKLKPLADADKPLDLDKAAASAAKAKKPAKTPKYAPKKEKTGKTATPKKKAAKTAKNAK